MGQLVAVAVAGRVRLAVVQPDRDLGEPFPSLDGPEREHVPHVAGVHEVACRHEPDGRLLKVAEGARRLAAGQAAGLPGGGFQPRFGCTCA